MSGWVFITYLLTTLAWDYPVYNPVVVRYMRIQTRPFLTQVYSHTKSKVVSSFIPADTQALSVVQDTIYDLMENKTRTIEPKDNSVFLLRHFVTHAITYEVNEVVHEVVNQANKMFQ